jgi:histone H3/H4
MAEMIIPYPQLQKILERTCELAVIKPRAEEMMDIVEKKLADLFEVAYENAKAENSETIKLRHIPITKGFKNSMNLFRAVIEDENVQMEPIRKYVLKKIPGDKPLEEDVVNELPIITGTLFVLVGRVIKALHPEIKNVYPEHIEEAKKVLDYTL